VKSISSIYSLVNISSNNYGNLNISGTTNYPMATLSSGGIYSQGYMFVPYIMSQTLSVIIDRRYEIVLRRQKIEKLNKLNSL
jgi:hypothetical protein